MVATIPTRAAERVWGTFERDRAHLARQFSDIPWAPGSGLTADELALEAEAYLDEHAEEPRVLQKAGVFHLVVTRGRIAIDPRDWFAVVYSETDAGEVGRRLGKDGFYIHVLRK